MNRQGTELVTVLYVRCKPDLLAKLDKLKRELLLTQPGQSISRSDVARMLLYEGLKEEENDGD